MWTHREVRTCRTLCAVCGAPGEAPVGGSGGGSTRPQGKSARDLSNRLMREANPTKWNRPASARPVPMYATTVGWAGRSINDFARHDEACLSYPRSRSLVLNALSQKWRTDSHPSKFVLVHSSLCTASQIMQVCEDLLWCVARRIIECLETSPPV